MLIQDQDQDQDSAVSRPRPILRCPIPSPRLKTYKTNTGSPLLGWTVKNKKTEKVVSINNITSIPVVAHSKQQNIIPSITTVLFRPKTYPPILLVVCIGRKL